MIEDAMSKGRQQTDVVNELDWSRAALIKFMRKNKMPKWERTSAAVREVMADLTANGQKNRTQTEVAEQAGIPKRTFKAAVKRMKRNDDGFTWDKGGVNEKVLTARQTLGAATEDGTVRASRRSSGRRMLSAAESCSRIRTPASPSPLVGVDSSLGCSSWRSGRIMYL